MAGRRIFLKSASTASAYAMLGSFGRAAFAQPHRYDSGPVVHRMVPLNSEPRPDRLAAGFITAQDDFYIRNHGTTPVLVEAGYTIRMETPGAAPRDLELAQLKNQFPRRSITAVMQCAGNRRADMGKYKSVSGDAWHAGAIGNATWGGIGLGDLLEAMGVDRSGDLHVAFAAHDDIEEQGEKFKFGVSIPLAKAMALESMIAFDMNGQALTPAHGFPARIVIPGYAGVRSPKWLASIKVQDKPSDNHIQQKEYKLFPPDVTSQTVDLSQGPFINDMPLNSAVLLPAEGAVVRSGRTNVRGWAIATTRRVAKVEVSADKGETWTVATLDSHPEAPWSWTPWSAAIDLPKGRHDVVVRAFDGGGGSQPASAAPIWNFPGYLSTAWHRVEVRAI